MTDITLDQFITKHALTVTATALPFRFPVHSPARDREWDKTAIHFATEIKNGDGKVVWRGCYSVGAAHPEMWAREHASARLRGHLETIRQAPRSIDAENARKAIREAYSKAAPLDLVDVLQSLQLDFQGVGEGFADWCDNLGYNADSRSALSTYQQCEADANAFGSALGVPALAEFLSLDIDE
ncbi:MAG: hypothetical protein ACR2RE_19730 [Geminicoccaceae bacterium]